MYYCNAKWRTPPALLKTYPPLNKEIITHISYKSNNQHGAIPTQLQPRPNVLNFGAQW